MSTIDHATAARTSRASLALRGVTALALLVDAVVHIRLAPGDHLSAPSGIWASRYYTADTDLAAVDTTLRGG